MLDYTYLRQIELGKNDWWRYVAGLLIVAFSWAILGSLPLLLLLINLQVNGSLPEDASSEMTSFAKVQDILQAEAGIHPYATLVIVAYSGFIFMLLAVLLTTKFIHRRSVASLFTSFPQIRVRRILEGFGVWFALLAAITILEYAIRPEVFRISFEASSFLAFLPIAIIFSPIQTSAEEALFRGYLLQGSYALAKGSRKFALMMTRRVSSLKRKVKREKRGKLDSLLEKLILAKEIRAREAYAVFALIFTTVLFWAVHLANPEIDKGLVLASLVYLGVGLLAGLITLNDRGTELALGLHAANNLFIILFVNYADSALPSPSIFEVTKMDLKMNLLLFVIAALAFYMYFFHWKKRPQDEKEKESPIATSAVEQGEPSPAKD